MGGVRTPNPQGFGIKIIILIMNKKFIAVATFAFAFAFATVASAANASDIYTSATGYLKTGSGMGAKVSQMANVIAAQRALNECNVNGHFTTSPVLALDGKMGPLTDGYFKAFQTSQSLVADGIIGPLTAAKLAACSGTSTPSTPSTPDNSSLNGSFGTISGVNNLSQYNNEQVGEGQEGVKVAGLEVKTSNDGDIALVSMKIKFTITNGSGSNRLTDYASKVTLMQGSKEIASANASDFNKDSAGVYSKTINVSNSVVKAKTTEKFYIALDAASSFDSGDIDSEIFNVQAENIRYKDGSSVVTTENGYDLGTNVPVNFVSYATAADTKLKLLTDSSSPSAGIVKVDTINDTNDVPLLKGKMKLEGTSDVTINSFPVTITADGSIATLVADASTSFKLVIDGNEYTESATIAAASGVVTFDNGDQLDLKLNAGDTVNFAVYADINDIQTDGVYPMNEGGTLTASVTSTNRANIDVENSQGDQLTDGTEKTGAVTGEAQEFRSSAATFTFVSSSYSAGTATSNNTGVFHIKFKVAAGDDSVYVSSLVANAVNYVVDRAGIATTGGVSAVITNITDASLDNNVGLNEINPGSPETFDLSVSVTVPTAGAAGQYRLSLTGIKWGTDAADATPNEVYSSNLGSFVTDYQVIN